MLQALIYLARGGGCAQAILALELMLQTWSHDQTEKCMVLTWAHAFIPSIYTPCCTQEHLDAILSIAYAAQTQPVVDKQVMYASLTAL